MTRRILLLCACWSLATSFVYGKPAQVILIRHAEKPETGDDLSLKGRERAAALVPLFTDADNGVPVAIYAQGASDKHRSRRPVETVAPLARELKLDLKTFRHGDFAAMVREILTKNEYDDKLVLICWEHKEIPEVAAALGVADPPDWPGHAFDRLWVISFKNGKARLQNLPQRLLYGDSSE